MGGQGGTMTGVSLQQGKSAPCGSCTAMGSRFWSRAHGRKPENPASFYSSCLWWKEQGMAIMTSMLYMNIWIVCFTNSICCCYPVELGIVLTNYGRHQLPMHRTKAVRNITPCVVTRAHLTTLLKQSQPDCAGQGKQLHSDTQEVKHQDWWAGDLLGSS